MANIANDGIFEIRVNASDLAGNISDTAALSITIDTTPPILTNLFSSTSSPTQTPTSSFSFTGSDYGSGLSHFTCEFNGVVTSPCTSPKSIVLIEGLNRFRVKVVNRAQFESAFQVVEINHYKVCLGGYKPVSLTMIEGIPVDFKIPIECANSNQSTSPAQLVEVSNWISPTTVGVALDATSGSIVGTPQSLTDVGLLESRLFTNVFTAHRVQFKILGLIDRSLDLNIRILPAHCSSLTGVGTVENPYKIRNKNDFFCMNTFTLEKNNWVLEADLQLQIQDTPIQFLNSALNYGRYSFVRKFMGNFDGKDKKLSYFLDCTIIDCPVITSNISFFRDIQNAQFKSLRSWLKFKNKPVNSIYFQSISGLVGFGMGNNSFTKVKAELEVENALATQNISGLAGNLGSNESEKSDFFEVDTSVKILNSTPQNLAGLVGSSSNATVKNSVVRIEYALPNGQQVSRLGVNGHQTASATYGNENHKYKVENSYLNITALSLGLGCTFYPFGGFTINNDTALSSNNTITNSFWVGQVLLNANCTAPAVVGPAKWPTSEYGNSMTQFNFDPTIWRADSNGLPILRWLD